MSPAKAGHYVLQSFGKRSSARSSLDRLPEDLDRRDIDPPAGTVAASRQQIDEADLVDLAQVRLVDEVALGDDGVDVEPQPADVGERELALQPIAGRPVGVIADQPRAVRELDDRPDLVKARDLRDPSNAGEAGQVAVVVLVAERDGAGRRAASRP